MPNFVITKLKITNYQGIESLALDVGEGGGIFEGANGSGKTSAIDAILAALVARGTKPENVRVGKNRSEILIDIGDLKVRRLIRAGGGTELSVIPDDGLGSAARLAALLKPAALNPLSFFLAKADERERMLLDAIPMKVAPDDMRRWLGPDAPLLNLDRHGLQVLKDLRKFFFEKRAAAKRELADRAKATEAAGAAALDASLKPGAMSVQSVEECQALVEKMRRQAAELAGARQAFE